MDTFLILATAGQFIATIGFLGYIFLNERKRNQAREQDLLNMLVAKNLPEYAQCQGILQDTPEGRLKIIKAENDLAVSAAKMEREERRKRGIPVS